MTALYVPPTEESDHKKQNQSLQLIGGVTTTNTAAIAALNAATYVNSFNARTGVVVPVQGDYPTSLIPGTATNDNATAGNIGEYISSNVAPGSAVALVSATAKDVTSISLTAGDWDVTGNVGFNPNAATTQSVLLGYIGLVSNTLPTDPNSGAYVQLGLSFTAGSRNILPVGTLRVSIASTTTVYLGALAAFAVNTNAAYGFIRARRVR